MYFVAIRKNHTFGRIWEEGDVVDASNIPNRHFAPSDADGNITGKPIVRKDIPVIRDPMKATTTMDTSVPTTFSQMARSKGQVETVNNEKSAGNQARLVKASKKK